MNNEYKEIYHAACDDSIPRIDIKDVGRITFTEGPCAGCPVIYGTLWSLGKEMLSRHAFMLSEGRSHEEAKLGLVWFIARSLPNVKDEPPLRLAWLVRKHEA